MSDGNFIEIYCKADLKTCEVRDVKGLYQKVRAGEIPFFTGISSPYEEPECPELVVDTGNKLPLEKCASQVVQFLRKKAILPLATKPLRGLCDCY